MIRCPHSRQRIGSLGLISFFAPQSEMIEYGCKKSPSARTCADVLHILSRRGNVCASACISVHGCLLLAHCVLVNATASCENRDIWKVTLYTCFGSVAHPASWSVGLPLQPNFSLSDYSSFASFPLQVHLLC
jgi:hypothetical protein